MSVMKSIFHADSLTITQRHASERFTHGLEIIGQESGECISNAQIELDTCRNSIDLFFIQHDKMPCRIENVAMMGEFESFRVPIRITYALSMLLNLALLI